ncbi:MAG: hypothetical protein JWN30_1232 [Bacilli bacterium]|nr:hypothetical protein [Bacilli bacterium]
MKRSKKIILVSHCVINQNTVIPEEARSSGIMQSAIDWCHEQGFGAVQLPCPEFTLLGPDRPPMTREQYDTSEYRAHCRVILQPVIDQLKIYQQHDYDIVGGLGISHSPSCDPGRGIFMEELQKMAKEQNIAINFFWQIPATESGEFNATDPSSVFGPV